MKSPNLVEKGSVILIETERDDFLEARIKEDIDTGGVTVIMHQNTGYLRMPETEKKGVKKLSDIIDIPKGYANKIFVDIFFPNVCTYLREDLYNEQRRTIPTPFRPGC